MVTKKQYNSPKVVEAGNAVYATQGTIWFFRDRWFGRRLIP